MAELVQAEEELLALALGSAAASVLMEQLGLVEQPGLVELVQEMELV